ncbi:hypothetical protein YC2023_101733 [Brassica napus]
MGVGGGEGEQRRSNDGEMMAISSLFNDQQNPIQQLQVKFKEVEVGFKTWLSKQSIPVEAAVVSTMSGVQGAFIGGLMGTLSPEMPQTDPQAMASMKQAQALVGGPWVQARNFAAITGVNAGIACVMKQGHGHEQIASCLYGEATPYRLFCMLFAISSDFVETLRSLSFCFDFLASMAETEEQIVMSFFDYLCDVNDNEMYAAPLGFMLYEIILENLLMKAKALGSGFAYSLVSQGLQGQPINAITTAAGFALGERFSKPSPEDPFYTRSRTMLLKLGLQKYEKNFKKGLLTDPTLPLLTDSALRDVSIPPGPRLLILDHIQRDPEINGKRGK